MPPASARSGVSRNRPLSEFILAILAVWRATKLLKDEDGPYEIFGLIRDRAGVKYNQRNIAYSRRETGKMFLCFWCLSVWVGLVAALLLRRPWWHALSLSGAAVLIEEARLSLKAE